MHVRVCLQTEQLVDRDRPHLAHPAQVVPQEVDDHQVLGTVLGACPELLAQRCVLRAPAPRGAGPLDRPRLDLPAAGDPQEALRGGAEDGQIAKAKEAP